jgi:hypothetical protein
LDGFTRPGAPVTAIAQTDVINLFMADPNGEVLSGVAVTAQGHPAEPLGRAHADTPPGILTVGKQSWVVATRPSSPNWAASQDSEFPFDRKFEWRQVIDVIDGMSEHETAVVPGATGTSSLAAASGWIRNPENSGADVPFAHPFGGWEDFPYGRLDWEFGLQPDPTSFALLSPANFDIKSKDASEVPGTLGVECEQALLPASFRGNVSHGDRVAIFGRWILDQGHSITHALPDSNPKANYRTEIHPPLLIATGSIQQDSGGQFTRVLLWSRPYLWPNVHFESERRLHRQSEGRRHAHSTSD